MLCSQSVFDYIFIFSFDVLHLHFLRLLIIMIIYSRFKYFIQLYKISYATLITLNGDDEVNCKCNISSVTVFKRESILYLEHKKENQDHKWLNAKQRSYVNILVSL